MRWLIDIINRLGAGVRVEPTRGVAPTWQTNPHACRCGPGFCANERGVGYVGSCSQGDGKRTAASDCPRCGAPHQSTRGCWRCQTRSADMTKPLTVDERVNTDFWMRCLREGVRGDEVTAMQDTMFAASGALLGPEEALDRVLAQRRGTSTPNTSQE